MIRSVRRRAMARPWSPWPACRHEGRGLRRDHLKVDQLGELLQGRIFALPVEPTTEGDIYGGYAPLDFSKARQPFKACHGFTTPAICASISVRFSTQAPPGNPCASTIVL